jgi:hypothetical protein
MTYVEHAFALLGVIWVARGLREFWRTRKDKGYSTRDTGAF